MPDLKVRKIGNSLGVIFPSELVKEKKLRENETVFVSVAKKGDLSKLFGSLKGWKIDAQKVKDEARRDWNR
ncbi:MAG: hypothetical protein HYU56_04175 [Candidatus Aenigmarchaeota archaeon]|nr:hypothetical protein [Candidatus Aenigmarchaeota archaeon]MBS3052998.1 hypothetical protein [Candidatus Aenigmarchaeota archaeon]